jgi:hypothetical protein
VRPAGAILKIISRRVSQTPLCRVLLSSEQIGAGEQTLFYLSPRPQAIPYRSQKIRLHKINPVDALSRPANITNHPPIFKCIARRVIKATFQSAAQLIAAVRCRIKKRMMNQQRHEGTKTQWSPCSIGRPNNPIHPSIQPSSRATKTLNHNGGA